MGEWNGKTVVKGADGRMYLVDPGTPLEAGETLAAQDEVDARAAEKRELERYGGAGQQALAAVEQVARTASFGAIGGGPEAEARERVFRAESPVLSLGAQAAGAVVPGLLTGGAASGAAAGLGLGARAAGIAGVVAEGAASGLAGEVEQARFEGRRVSPGNVLMWGVGGELLGRAVPAVLRLGAGKLKSAIGDEIKEAVGSPLLQAERKALDATADVAEGVPYGPSRDELLANADESVINTASQRMASSLDTVSEDFYDLGDIGKKKTRLKAIVAPTSDVQHRWAADASRSLIDTADEIAPPASAGRRAATPDAPQTVQLPEGKVTGKRAKTGRAEAPQLAETAVAGRSIEDLKAISLAADDRANIDWLKQDPTFSSTGNVADEFGSSRGGLPAFEVDEAGNVVLQNGRHRLAAARELEREYIQGRIVKRGKRGGVLWEYEGPIRVAPRADAPVEAAAPSTAGASGAKSVASKARKTLIQASAELDPAVAERGSIDYFIAADRAKRSMQKQVQSIAQSLRKVTDLETQAELERIQGVLRNAQEQLRVSLEDTSLWGKGAELQKGVNAAWHDSWFRGADVVEHDLARVVERPKFADAFPVRRYDPGKLRSYLKHDEVGRGLTPERLEHVLSGAEKMIGAHKRFGTAEPAQIARMEKALKSIREQVALSDDLQGAKKRWDQDQAHRKALTARDKEAAREAKELEREQARTAKEAEREAARATREGERDAERRSDAISGLAGLAVGAAADSVGLGAVAALAAKGLRYSKLLGNLTRTGDAAIKTAAKGAIKGSSARALRAVERGTQLAPIVGVPLATTVLSRFQGDYPTPQASYEAKRKTLEAMARDPLLLPRALAAGLGDLQETHPDVYAATVGRLAQIAAYLHASLPSQTSASITRPNGIPPSRSTLREFALKWNSALSPYTVYEDVRDGLASPIQVRALAATHPEEYEQLKREMLTEAVENPEAMTTQRKLRLDILFQEDGVAGKAYSWPLAMAIKQAGERPQQGGRAPAPRPQRAPMSRGLSAISSSVTNA